jgi:hypothetical protein
MARGLPLSPNVNDGEVEARLLRYALAFSEVCAYAQPSVYISEECIMAASNFDKCFKFILQFEGGFTNDPKDPGGPTNLGITQATLSAFIGRQATIAEVKALTPAKAAPIYRGKFWDHVNGDNLPVGIDLAVFDFGVHSGPSRGASRHCNARWERSLTTARSARSPSLRPTRPIPKPRSTRSATIAWPSSKRQKRSRFRGFKKA